jgi:Glycosyl hydrolase family 63 C-terminal domain
MDQQSTNPELERLAEDRARAKNWKRWGPYLSERQWATVREDYSQSGDPWTYFPHEQARSRAYRWGEDGLLGFTDRECRLCFSIALWNGQDSILKERLFGLTGPEGNHGEDVKECYYYLDSTPTHSYCRALYKYPQSAFPYEELVSVNRRRGRNDLEYEITDTSAFANNAYFDVFVEYAKASPNDIRVRIRACNRADKSASLTLLPVVWFRNSWEWKSAHEGCIQHPKLKLNEGHIEIEHESLEPMRFYFAPSSEVVFTNNQTNFPLLFDVAIGTPYAKDAFSRYVAQGDQSAVNPAQVGTKAAPVYRFNLGANESKEVICRLVSIAEEGQNQPFSEQIFQQRKAEADRFYSGLTGDTPVPAAEIARQAWAGLLWSKQFYHYIVRDWLCGDPGQPTPPASRLGGRNRDWPNVYSRDVISMPDKWEYPWFAAWDLAFQMLPFAELDPEFAKQQLSLFVREWYMHPNGQLPAYEFAFSDVNPPVQAWAAWRVYKIASRSGPRDRVFLESVFHKFLLNFTWWVNRKDKEGKNIFSGGFLGLDNIGVFDRSSGLPGRGYLQQSDGTAWMAFYSLTMLSIALELAQDNPVYEDMASKFFEHFIAICDAMNSLGGTGLWDESDGFYYDQLKLDGKSIPLKTRSMVGLLPLIAVEVLDDEQLKKCSAFKKRMDWFLAYRPDLASIITFAESRGHRHRLLAVPSKDRLISVLHYLLDEREFLSPFGIRSLSKVHDKHPFVLTLDSREYRVGYAPGESRTALFGGNSNWRGPVWFPVNYLIIEALERYHHFFGNTLQIECPIGSGKRMNLEQVANEISQRLTRLFIPDERGRRPCHGTTQMYANDPHWRDLVLFYEYFHAETGRGCGASHQTGWTALVSRLLSNIDVAEMRRLGPRPERPR